MGRMALEPPEVFFGFSTVKTSLPFLSSGGQPVASAAHQTHREVSVSLWS